MLFDDAREVLWVAALERGDGDSDAADEEARRGATDAAPDPGEPGDMAREDAFLVARARAIAAGDSLRSAHAPLGLLCLPLLIPLLLGFISKELAGAGVINILAFPLLGLMAWSVLVYGTMLVLRLAGRSDVHMLPERLIAGARPSGSRQARFDSMWRPLAMPVMRWRLSTWLHLAAAVFAIGAVLGMYWQGLARDYDASWESTFLSAGAVRSLLAVALAPGTWWPGLALPDVAGIEAIRAPASEHAGLWIHRYALAAAIVVIVPRLLLAFLAGRRATKQACSLDVRPAAPRYFQDLLDEKRGVQSIARVLPHRMNLEPAQRDALRADLHKHWGNSVWVDFLEPVAFGEEADFRARAGELEGSDYVVLAASLAATPEDESQGELLRSLRGQGEVMLWLDASGFESRFGTDRAVERKAAWQKLATDHNVVILNTER